DLGLHLRWPPRHHRAAGVAGVQLELRRLPGCHDRLGDHCRRGWCHRSGASRSVRDAAVLWLPHGRLLQPLAADGPRTLRAAARLLRQLVPQGRQWQVHLARLLTEHAGAGVDREPRARQGRGDRISDRLDAALRGPALGWPGIFEGDVPGTDERRPRAVEERAAVAPRTLRAAVRPVAAGVSVHARTDSVVAVAEPGEVEPGAREGVGICEIRFTIHDLRMTPGCVGTPGVFA